MKLSTKGRYGLRLMIELALHEKNELVTLKEISKQQEISQKYLWSLITPLQKAGLVRAERGARGGYMLARPASKITLRDIVVEVEGPLSIVECVKRPSVCHRNALCVARDVWTDVSAKIENALKSITLKDIVASYKKKESAILKVRKRHDAQFQQPILRRKDFYRYQAEIPGRPEQIGASTVRLPRSAVKRADT